MSEVPPLLSLRRYSSSAPACLCMPGPSIGLRPDNATQLEDGSTRKKHRRFFYVEISQQHIISK